MGLCLLLTLPLEFVFGARVYRRFRALLLAVAPEVLLFSVWDIAGIARDHWTYNSAFITGLRLPFRMPVEELVFFVVVPICGVLTYEAVGVVLHKVRRFRTGVAGRRARA
jgi:lycopene cyclase domain-containing protein